MKTGAERRAALKQILEEETKSGEPVSASALAARLNVSRQIIVGDIALLRTGGFSVDATPRGYVLRGTERGIRHTIVCCHDAEQMLSELYTIADCGCTVCDVSVEHPIYGLFAKKVREADALPLSVLTEGTHAHTILCPTETAFARVTEALIAMGILKK
ncbi:MAG: transcription repressor NadR [Clostridia bacterium]|nr:transcription repressor NadR [Clostridia bacterium]